MKNCPFCNREISDNSRFCIYCMSPLAPKKPAEKIKPQKKSWQTASVVLLALTITTVLILSAGQGKSQPSLITSQSTIQTQSDISSIWESSDFSSLFSILEDSSSQGASGNNTSTNATSSSGAPASSSNSKLPSTSINTSSKLNNSSQTQSSSPIINNVISPELKEIISVLNSGYISIGTTYTDGDYTYAVNDNKAIIVKANSELSGEVVIPSKLGGYNVTILGEECFKSCSKVTSVIIPEGVTQIGYSAFSYCKAIKSVTIPNTIVKIDMNAFFYCSALSEINIPDKLITIGANAFNLTAYHSNRDNWESDNTLYLKRILIDTSGCSRCEPKEGTIALADGVYFDCDVDSFKLPESLIYIAPTALTNCRGIKNITIPSHVKYIGDSAFCDMERLRSVTIENGITTLTSGVFSNCEDIETARLPKSITTIESFVFSNCTSLTDVYYEGSQADRDKILVNLPQTSSLFSATWHYNS